MTTPPRFITWLEAYEAATVPADWYTRHPAYVPAGAIPVHVEDDREREVLDQLEQRVAWSAIRRHGWRVAAAHIADAADLLAHQRPEAAEFLDDVGRGRG